MPSKKTNNILLRLTAKMTTRSDYKKFKLFINASLKQQTITVSRFILDLACQVKILLCSIERIHQACHRLFQTCDATHSKKTLHAAVQESCELIYQENDLKIEIVKRLILLQTMLLINIKPGPSKRWKIKLIKLYEHLSKQSAALIMTANNIDSVTNNRLQKRLHSALKAPQASGELTQETPTTAFAAGSPTR